MTTTDGNIIQDTYGNVANAILRIGDIYERREQREERRRQIEENRAERLQALSDRHDERESRYAVTLASDFVKNNWNGTDVIDGKTGKSTHVKGISELDWRELEAEETTVSEKTGELVKSVREQDFYRNLTPDQKRLFDRDWFFKQNELMRAASVRQGQLVAARAKEHDEETMAWNTNLVGERFGSVDGSYEKTREWATVQNYGIMMGTALKHRDLLANPATTFDDIAKAEKWDEKETAFQRRRFDNLRATFDRLRIKALTEAGAGNNPIGAYSPQAALVEAARLTNVLNGNLYGVDEKTGAKKTGKDKDGNDLHAPKQYITDQERNAYLEKIEDAEKSRLQKANALAAILDKKANEEDVDEYSKTTLAGLDPNFVPDLSRNQKLDAILRDKRLSPSSRSQLMKKWANWYDAREADAAERRSKNGYEMQLPNGKSVWISASRWGQTQADVYHWFTTDAIARDPVTAIARAEALKSTGSISKEDYTHVLATATSFQSTNVVEAANKTLGGTFFSLVDKTHPEKGKEEGSDFGDVLAYKYDPTARHGFTGQFQTRGFFGGARKSSMTDDMRQLDNTGEKLFTPEEKMYLFREIGWMASRGYTQDQIDSCVQMIVAPKMQLYYNMTMAERLRDQSFVRSIRETVTSFDDKVSAIVSKTTDRKISKVKNAPEE